MVGAVYYAAIRNNQTGEVWAAVCLTSSSKKDVQFCYKDMSEEMGPVESKCPAGILNLLTPTTDEYALKWRERCRDSLKNKSITGVKIGVKIGDKIEFSDRWNCAGIAKVVNKIRSSYVLNSDTFGTFKISSTKINESMNSGSIKIAT
jgi:hypothetical protein